MQEQRTGLGIPPPFIPNESKGLYVLKRAGDTESLELLMMQYRLSKAEFEDGLRGAVRENPGIVSDLLGNPEENRYRLGLVAGLMGSDPSIRQVFKPIVQEGVSLRVTSSHSDWLLCPDAEDYMKKALKRDALVLVNGSILMKTVGKFTGLCVGSFSTSQATFLEGNWYSPVDQESRDAVRQGFDRGDARVDLTEGAWVLLRSVFEDKSGQEVLARSKQKAKDLPRRLPSLIRGIPRKQFRLANNEAMK